MAKLKDMANKPSEEKEKAEAIIAPSKYPYGLCLRLDEDVMAKLGLDPDDAEVGDTVELQAVAKITAVSQNSRETEDGSKDCACVELQITDMAVGEDDDERDEKRRGRWYSEDE